jgi:hypothetical protein
LVVLRVSLARILAHSAPQTAGRTQHSKRKSPDFRGFPSYQRERVVYSLDFGFGGRSVYYVHGNHGDSAWTCFNAPLAGRPVPAWFR